MYLKIKTKKELARFEILVKNNRFHGKFRKYVNPTILYKGIKIGAWKAELILEYLKKKKFPNYE